MESGKKKKRNEEFVVSKVYFALWLMLCVISGLYLVAGEISSADSGAPEAAFAAAEYVSLTANSRSGTDTYTAGKSTALFAGTGTGNEKSSRQAASGRTRGNGVHGIDDIWAVFGALMMTIGVYLFVRRYA